MVSSEMLNSEEIGLLKAVIPPGSRVENRSSKFLTIVAHNCEIVSKHAIVLIY